MIEEMSKMVLTQFSSILSPKTLAKFSSPKTSTPASSVTTATSIEKIRQCTCSESDDCISEAYRTYSKCQNSCKSHLEYYSSKPEEFILCIPKNPSGFSTINKCLKENIQDFCSDSDGSRITFIQKPNYNQSLTFEFNFDFGKAVIDMVVLEHLKAFYSCAGSCMKEKIVGCYNRKLCGVNLPKNHDLGNIGYFCPAFQSSVNSNLIKALPCFAMQQIFPKFFN
uniref:Uncharacterized protein n=1 Tax=Panagrolaimus davidi TaxID=227884 RepID=A0A914PIE7_9BILA